MKYLEGRSVLMENFINGHFKFEYTKILLHFFLSCMRSHNKHYIFTWLQSTPVTIFWNGNLYKNLSLLNVFRQKKVSVRIVRVTLILWTIITVECIILFMPTITEVIYKNKYNKVDSIVTGHTVIPDLWSNQENCLYITLFQLPMIKFYRHYVMYKYNPTFSLIWTTY